MFVVEGELAFNTQKAVGNARAFQKELKTTGRVAEEVSKRGGRLEESFQGLGSQKTRAAIRGLQSTLAGAKDGTDAVISSAKALQIALVKSVAGTAIVTGAGVLGDAVRDVGNRIGAAADESARATRNFSGFATSIQEGIKRQDEFAASAENTRKALEGLRDANLVQSIIFRASGGEKVLKDLEERAIAISRLEFGVAAQTERITAEKQAGMSPEQIEADKRAKEEKRRLDEARRRGGEQAAEDVKRTIAAENLLRVRTKGAETQKKFDEDIAAFQAKTAEQAQKNEQEKTDSFIASLPPQQKIVELQSEQAKVSKEIADIQNKGIYGTEKKRKEQLDAILKLQERSFSIEKDIAKSKKEALDEEQKTKEEIIQRDIEERARQREFDRERKRLLDESQRRLAEVQTKRFGDVRQVGDQGILGASRAGQQDLDVARKQRARRVSSEDFKTQQSLLRQEAERMTNAPENRGTGKIFNIADARKSLATRQAAGEMPTLAEKLKGASTGRDAAEIARERAGGKDSGKSISDLLAKLDEVLNKITSAPLVTSGSGSN